MKKDALTPKTNKIKSTSTFKVVLILFLKNSRISFANMKMFYVQAGMEMGSYTSYSAIQVIIQSIYFFVIKLDCTIWKWKFSPITTTIFLCEVFV